GIMDYMVHDTVKMEISFPMILKKCTVVTHCHTAKIIGLCKSQGTVNEILAIQEFFLTILILIYYTNKQSG
ncbi:hypothetical protein RhiirC2_762173, partial [Rhizophagus irregularis]